MERLVPSENFCLTASVPREIAWFLVPIVLVGIVALTRSDVRRAFLNGWRCLARYPALWKIPLWFTLAYAAFQFANEFLLAWRSDTSLSTLAWLPPSHLTSLVRPSLLPALEALAATLNCLVATFPLSAFGGLLFICNFRGLSVELLQTLRKTFGTAGWMVFLILVVSAVCSIIKPLLLIGLPEVIEYLSFRYFFLVATAVNALSFVFEYLLGTCLQVYLILLACGWIRGSILDPEKLMRFAVRRLGFVFKWAVVIITATLAFLHLPMLIEVFFTGLPAPVRSEGLTRALLAGSMLALASVQIRLILHNETLRQALAAHARLLRERGWSVGIFLLAAFTLLAALKILENAGHAALGDSIVGFSANALVQGLAAIVGGWILASWACFYKGGSRTTPEIIF